MTAVLAGVRDDEDALWGFCAPCELWRFSSQWMLGGTTEPACPVCGSPPSALEVLNDGVARVQLLLELPPGGDIPFLS